MNKKQTETLKNVYKRNRKFYKSDTSKKFFYKKYCNYIFLCYNIA